MAGFFLLHAVRFSGKTVSVLCSFILLKQNFSTTLRLLRENLSSGWKSYRSLPLTAARREAMEHVNKAVELYNTKRYMEALAIFRDAIFCDPCYARAHLYLGNTLYKLHNHGEAVKAWGRAIAVEPNSEASVKAHLKLEHLKSQNQQAIHELHEQIKK